MKAPQPIASYGLIGDMRTAALIGLDGGIDWCCLPRFDSGSVFAALLDSERGGTWAVRPSVPWTSTQRYLPRTNILETTFTTRGGVVSLTDFMPVGEDGRPSGPHPEIHRHLRGRRGTVPMEMVFMPRFEYGARTTRLEVLRAGLFATDRTDQVLTLSSAVPFQWAVDQSTAVTRFLVEKGVTRWLVLRYDDDDIHPVDRYASASKLDVTAEYWQRWASRVRYGGPYRTMVKRSALVLKLLTHAETGAVIAAPTTSLPETIGGGRNWDYRFVWLRDAAFTLAALDAVGHDAEADAFMRFLKRVCRHEGGGHLQIMYGIDGRRDLVERQLEHLSGYLGSRPVRVGNGAAGQLQLDVYGEVLAAAGLFARFAGGLDRDQGRRLADVADLVCELWRRPDAGIWEVRSEPAHFTHSKMMCAIALDTAIRLAGSGLLPRSNVERWWRERDGIRAFVESSCFDAETSSYTRAAGESALDASLLLAVVAGYEPAEAPRLLGTVDAVRRELGRGPLVHRYRGDDGLPGEDGAFVACSFWLVEALARQGRTREAAALMDEVVALANDVGLYAEEIDPATGDFLGNFPQALSHLALINAATALEGAAG
jgi:GH15 family glucan-1,4-alpha-glucosidase